MDDFTLYTCTPYVYHNLCTRLGEFGIVYKGYLEVDRFATEIVAIKTLKGIPTLCAAIFPAAYLVRHTR